MAGFSRRSSQESRTPSQQDLAAERLWWSEAMTATIQNNVAEQTKQLQACVAEEAQKQRAMTAQVQRLLAERAQRPEGCASEEARTQARQLQVPPAVRAPGGGAAEAQHARVAPQGRLEGLLELEMEERRAGEADLRAMIMQHGGALARIEALVQPCGDPDEQGSLMDFEVVAEEEKHTGPTARSEWSPTGTGTVSDSTFGMGLVRANSAGISEGQGRSIQGCCRAIRQSRRFVVGTACVIAANSIYLGFEANATMTSEGFTRPDQTTWRLANGFFALAFLVELTVRWVAGGATFLSPRNQEFLWNWFDTLLIWFTICEEILRYFSVELFAFGFLRLTRILRVSRMMRAFKAVREFQELKIMVTGLLNCAKPLFWAGVLLLSLTFMVGVLIAQIITDYLRSVPNTDLGKEDMHAINYIAEHFSNLWETMYSLFEALTGGRDWGDIARPFRQIHWILVCCLVLYIVVGMFCILNLLTAVFLEAAHRIDDVQEIVHAKMDWVKETKKFFLNAIEDVGHPRSRSRDGNLSSELKPRITLDAFIKLLTTKNNVKFLEENGVDLFLLGDCHLKELFSIMDTDQNGDLDVDEFVGCLYSLKGAARSLDVKLEHQRTAHMISSLRKELASMQLTRSDTLSFRTSSNSRPRASSKVHAHDTTPLTSADSMRPSWSAGAARDPSEESSPSGHSS